MEVAPRVVMLTSRAETCVTLMPGTARSRSPMLVAGEFWMVSVVIRLTAAGALTSCCSVRDAVTTTCSSKDDGSIGIRWSCGGGGLLGRGAALLRESRSGKRQREAGGEEARNAVRSSPSWEEGCKYELR